MENAPTELEASNFTWLLNFYCNMTDSLFDYISVIFFLIFPTYHFVGILNPDHMQPNVVDLRDTINWVATYCFMLKFTKYSSHMTSNLNC